MWGEVVRRAVAFFAEVDGESTEGGAQAAAPPQNVGHGATREERGSVADHDEDWIGLLWSDSE